MLILENTTFKDNTGYHKGNDVLNVDQGIVIVNNKLISGSEGNIKYVESMSTVVSAIIVSAAAILTAVAVVTVVVCTFGTGIFAVGAGAAVLAQKLLLQINIIYSSIELLLL